MGRIYLTRHGKTLQNRLEEEEQHPADWASTPGFFDLTPEGQQQCRSLGQYLRWHVRDWERVYFLSSTTDRGTDSVALVAEGMGIDLGPHNYIQSDALREFSPLELLPYRLQQSNDPQIRQVIQRFYQPPSIVGRRIEQELLDAQGEGQEADLVAVLHKTVNTHLLWHLLGHDAPLDHLEDNCGLYILETGERAGERRIARVSRYYHSAEIQAAMHPYKAAEGQRVAERNQRIGA